MSEPISRVVAIKTFFGLTNLEVMKLWKGMSEEEKSWFAEESAKELGVELKSI